jgi:hypothetical protein
MQETNSSIISSYSKNDPGELFTYRIHLNLADNRFKRQKRIFDLILGLFYFLLMPLFTVLNWKNIRSRWKILYTVLKGEMTWFGYGKIIGEEENNLPHIPDGVWSLTSVLFSKNKMNVTQDKITRANSIYARHYTFNTDVNMLFQYILSRFN